MASSFCETESFCHTPVHFSEIHCLSPQNTVLTLFTLAPVKQQTLAVIHGFLTAVPQDGDSGSTAF